LPAVSFVSSEALNSDFLITDECTVQKLKLNLKKIKKAVKKLMIKVVMKYIGY